MCVCVSVYMCVLCGWTLFCFVLFCLGNKISYSVAQDGFEPLIPLPQLAKSSLGIKDIYHHTQLMFLKPDP